MRVWGHLSDHPVAVWSAASVAIGVIGWVDYATGAELRVFPLYYLPISLIAWYRDRPAVLLVAMVCGLSWLASNLLGGLRFSHPALWGANTMVQTSSFAVVGLLIATLRRSLTRERELSRTDPLTALSNSRAFYEEARRLLALCRRQHRPITVAYIDVDNFKAVNDRLGHQAGDELLKGIALQVRASIRPSDLSARLGGDEFAILLPELSQRDAGLTLERLRASLAAMAHPGGYPVTVSVGGVTFTVLPETVEQMVQRADARMYEAKSNGKDRVLLEVADGTATSPVPPRSPPEAESESR